MFKKILSYRQGQEKLVDQRVRLLGEIINNIRTVKLYSYENHFASKVSDLRQQEHSKLRNYGFMRAVVSSTFSFIPVLASICEREKHVFFLGRFPH